MLAGEKKTVFMYKSSLSNRANDDANSESDGNISSCCAPSTFSCVKDLGHKLVTLYTSAKDHASKLPQGQAGEGGGRRSKKCVWFSKDHGQPIFAMHSNCYLNSECFIIDAGISALPILPTYTLILFKEHIHVTEEDDTKFSLEFRDGSDSFAIWIQICAFQNVEPFTCTSVQLTRPCSTVPLENCLHRSCSDLAPSSSWLTMKFKAPCTSGSKSPNWFTFAKMQLFSITFRKWQYVVLLLKSDDPDEDAPVGIFCIRPGVTCLKTAKQLYYEPCDANSRKYILDFDNEALCEHIWSLVRLVTPRDFAFEKVGVEPMSQKCKRISNALQVKRSRRLEMIYRCFGQLRQEVKQIMAGSRDKLHEIIDIPEIHITKLFFSIPVWRKRNENLDNKRKNCYQRMGMGKFEKDFKGSFVLQCCNAKLHADIVKMLIELNVPAELIAEYRESLVRKLDLKVGGDKGVRCRRIHCLFI